MVKKESKDLTFEDAVYREIGEECGIRPKEIIHLDTFLHTTISNHLYRTAAYLITDYEGVVQNHENKADHLWVTFEEANNLLLFADSRYVLKLAKEALISEGLLEG